MVPSWRIPIPLDGTEMKVIEAGDEPKREEGGGGGGGGIRMLVHTPEVNYHCNAMNLWSLGVHRRLFWSKTLRAPH